MIVIYCGKIIASIYFSAFAIASMFGTTFNITYGPTVTKIKLNKKIRKSHFFDYYYNDNFFYFLQFYQQR